MFAAFRRGVNPASRLLLVGDDRGQERYLDRLQALARELEVAGDVMFAGHVEDDELMACYSVADLFLCLSEHEGFCVPLLEAMAFAIPVLAFDAGAVAETLSGAGVLLREKSPATIAELMGRLTEDTGLREAVLRTERRVIERVRSTDYGSLLLECLAPLFRSIASSAIFC